MDKHVILSIRGQQDFEQVDSDVVELVTEGTMTGGGEEYILQYQESELTGLGVTQTTFQIEKGRVTLLRVGQVNSQIVFEEGKRHVSMYDTPFGALTVGIDTRKMKVKLDETGGEIEISYAIEIDHAVAGENFVHISVRERDER